MPGNEKISQEEIKPVVTENLVDLTTKTATQIHTIKDTDEQIVTMAHDVKNILQAMKNKPSLFAKLVNSWDKVSIEVKLAIGIALLFPYILGVIAHVGALVAFSLIGGLLYTAMNFLADNYKQFDSQKDQELQECMDGFVNELGGVVSNLDSLAGEMDTSIEVLQGKNTELATTITTLGGEVKQLSEQNKKLDTDVKQTQGIADDLEGKKKGLDITLNTQTSLATQNQLVLQEATQKHNKAKAELEKKINELDEQQQMAEKNLTSLQSLETNSKAKVANFIDTKVEDADQKQALLINLQQATITNTQFIESLTSEIQAEEPQLQALENQSGKLVLELSTFEQEFSAVATELSMASNKLKTKLGHDSAKGMLGLFAHNEVTKGESAKLSLELK